MLFKIVNTVLVILQCGVDGEAHLLDHHRLIQVDQDLIPGDIDQIGMKRSIDLKFIKEQLTNRLVEENIGYGIYNVSIQDTEMPRDDVANAFKAVEDAKQGMETAINSAKKYQSENIPEAKAKADKLLQDAEAYKEQRINEANGQVARFEDTYAEYVKYPLITKKRMFYETMEEVLPDLKVIITGGNGTQTLLPLEPFSETASGSAAQTGGGN